MKADTIVYEIKNNVIRLAVLENGQMVEFDTYSKNAAAEGNIYLGRLTHKMELANGGVGFKVNIGDEEEAFLNATEFDSREINLAEGQSVVVQVAQERHADKGAKVTRNIQIVGTTVVYKPLRKGVDVSQKITDKEQVRALCSTIFHNMKGQEGWAVRTSAVDFDHSAIIEEMVRLRDIYEHIRIHARNASAPSLLYAREDQIFEYIRRYKDTLEKIVVNDHNLEKEVRDIIDVDVIYNAKPFEEYGLEDQLIEAINPESALKSGGKVYITQTKACVTIDVDSCSLRQGADVNELNTEAAVEIARQIRLKNLSGKIVVDFAGSKDYQFMKPVMDTLDVELADDACRGRVLGLTKAGNIEILRQRRRPSLMDLYTEECPTCQGTGRVEK